eukprot:3300169-Alexandrium_andersonii.AAC.1
MKVTKVAGDALDETTAKHTGKLWDEVAWVKVTRERWDARGQGEGTCRVLTPIASLRRTLDRTSKSGSRLRTARHATDRNDPIVIIPTRDCRARRAKGMQ